MEVEFIIKKEKAKHVRNVINMLEYVVSAVVQDTIKKRRRLANVNIRNITEKY